jgi:hypothetical protein
LVPHPETGPIASTPKLLFWRFGDSLGTGLPSLTYANYLKTQTGEEEICNSREAVFNKQDF